MKWLRADRNLLALVCVLTVTALLLRTWNLQNSLQFLGDQGRDALIVSNIFREYDPVFIGPVTSIGNMYLGPAYYYFMLPFLWLTYPSPLGPAFAVAFLGAATVFFLFFWGRQLVGTPAALIGAVLLAFSNTAIELSRFSWNPNPAPFVALVMVWATWKAQQNPRFWLVVAIAFSVILQLHYVAGLLGIGAVVIWLVQILQLRQKHASLRPLLVVTALAIVIVIVSFTPLVLFDIKNGGINAAGFNSLIGENEGFGSGSTLTRMREILSDFEGRAGFVLITMQVGTLAYRYIQVGVWVFILLLSGMLIQKLRHKKLTADGVWILSVYLLTSVFGLAAYQHSVFDHYVAFLFPVIFLLYGKMIALVVRWKVGWLVVLAVMGWYVWFQSQEYSFQPRGTTLEQLEERAQLIHNQLEPNEPYILVLLASHRDLYGMNYRYYLSVDREKAPLSPERYADARTLVIVNEEGLSNPTELPIFEIQTFGVVEPDTIVSTAEGVDILILRK